MLKTVDAPARRAYFGVGGLREPRVLGLIGKKFPILPLRPSKSRYLKMSGKVTLHVFLRARIARYFDISHSCRLKGISHYWYQG
jgi:hypothetical protein